MLVNQYIATNHELRVRCAFLQPSRAKRRISAIECDENLIAV